MSEDTDTRTWQLLRRLGIDLPLGSMQPSWWRLIVATVVAVIGSVAACALLAIVGEAIFPATTGYAHFAFQDYSRLTVVGVLIACAAWPVITLLSSQAPRIFFWLAVLVTVVSFTPDIWIWHQGQLPEGVLVLALMHVGVAVVTYPALVLIAPQQLRSPQ